jgi:hypothetical protein
MSAFRYLAALSICALLFAPPAQAVPSFAMQTGQPCSSCHTIAFGPALTPYGQQFKLNGYVWSDGKSPAPPLALMQLSSFTHTRSGQDGGAAPHYGANDNLAPDQTSLFYAGRIAGSLGAFVQGTYDGVGRTASWDNLDLRYARRGALAGLDWVWGLTLNNNPSVQDLWNSTPAWAFPYAASSLAPAPAAAPLIEGALAQNVLGLSAYTMVSNLLYLEAGAYKRLPSHLQKALGLNPDDNPDLRGLAPYWRAAIRHGVGAHYFSLGLFGLASRIDAGDDASQGADHLVDLGYDATWQWNGAGAHRFNANLSYVHELQNSSYGAALGKVAKARKQLNTLRFNGGWIWKQTVSLSGGPFLIRGGADPLLYAPDPLDGSASGSPDSRGWIAQAEWVPFGKLDSWLRPWVNARLGLQYTLYSEFNGGRRNYDGSGRDAHDNDTLFVFLWTAF